MTARSNPLTGGDSAKSALYQQLALVAQALGPAWQRDAVTALEERLHVVAAFAAALRPRAVVSSLPHLA